MPAFIFNIQSKFKGSGNFFSQGAAQRRRRANSRGTLSQTHSEQLHKGIGEYALPHEGLIIISFKEYAAIRLNIAGVDGRKADHI